MKHLEIAQMTPFPQIDRRDPLTTWRRGIVIDAVARLGGKHRDAVAKSLYGTKADEIIKAAVTGASTTGWGSALVTTAAGAFIRSLRPRSAAARLFDRAPRFSLDGVGSLNLPRWTGEFPNPPWVGEGGAIPVLQGGIANALVGPAKKLAALVGLSSELASLTAQSAEAIIREGMEVAAAKALDSSLFSNAAATELRPAGLLNGVTPIAATAGGGINAMTTDLRNLVGGIADAGLGGGEIMIFANPRQAISLKLQAQPGFDLEIVPTTALPSGTIVAVEVEAFATAFDVDPDVQISENAVIHLEDTNPLQLASGAQGSAVVATPTRSAFQTATHVLRLILDAAWAVRQPGAVQVVQSATW
jgi:hypothetical protein